MTSNSTVCQNESAVSISDLIKLRPKIPARPILSLDVFVRKTSDYPSVLDIGQVKLTFNARVALALALRNSKIGHGASVLLPAYHCPAMVSPVVWLGAKPIFYPIRPDTSVDVEVLAKYIRSDTRALIAVHYFGFIQDMRPLRKLCDEHDLILIEDCAHAFFGRFNGQALGAYGDYAIASIMKFLPVYEGGCLVSSKRSLSDITTSSGGFFLQLKSSLNTLEIACEYGRLPWLNYLLRAKEWLWNLIKPRVNQGGITLPPESIEDTYCEDFKFDQSLIERSMSWFSIAIMKTMSFSRTCAQRRANYLLLLNALSNITGGRPLFETLPDNVCPLVFPMLIDAPGKVFSELKQAGVPIIRFGEYRWNGVDAMTCPVSDDLSRRVFQFPCHQSLTPQEIDWMITSIVSALNNSE